MNREETPASITLRENIPYVYQRINEMTEDSRRMFDAFQEQNKANELIFNKINTMIDQLP
jgi:hypothetical protein